MKTYLNIKDGNAVETIDEFETWAEAKKMKKEYDMAYGHNRIYLSQRCTKDWRKDND